MSEDRGEGQAGPGAERLMLAARALLHNHPDGYHCQGCIRVAIALREAADSSWAALRASEAALAERTKERDEYKAAGQIHLETIKLLADQKVAARAEATKAEALADEAAMTFRNYYAQAISRSAVEDFLSRHAAIRDPRQPEPDETPVWMRPHVFVRHHGPDRDCTAWRHCHFHACLLDEDHPLHAPPSPPPPNEEPVAMCGRCGKPLTKAQGGTTFTVCDDCWSVPSPEPSARAPRSGTPSPCYPRSRNEPGRRP